MPCKDGTRVITLPDRTEIMDKEKGPYLYENLLGHRNTGCCKHYKMVTRYLQTTKLTVPNKFGLEFQLSPNPKYNPFGEDDWK